MKISDTIDNLLRLFNQKYQLYKLNIEQTKIFFIMWSYYLFEYFIAQEDLEKHFYNCITIKPLNNKNSVPADEVQKS